MLSFRKWAGSRGLKKFLCSIKKTVKNYYKRCKTVTAQKHLKVENGVRFYKMGGLMGA